MRTYSKKPPSKTQPASTTIPSRILSGHSREASYNLNAQSTAGEQVVQRFSQSGSDDHKTSTITNQLSHTGHNFSRIPVRAKSNIQQNHTGAAIVQRQEVPQNNQSSTNTGDNENNTGMPDNLKTGLEHLSGFNLSTIRVHYNSPKPARINALAYTAGTNIHLGPGQQRHLPHEGWHVVQQMSGRVTPTVQAKGISINNDMALEREADVMGVKAWNTGSETRSRSFQTRIATAAGAGPEDKPFVTPVRLVSEAPAWNTGKPPVIQRTASFVAGTVNATTNMAAHLIAGNMDAGFTPPVLNGSTVLSTGATSTALNAPTLGNRTNANGTADVWVKSVPKNEASYTMQIPSNGPWSTNTIKANVAALFTTLGLSAQAGCSTAGNTTFSVNGQPSDADFAANIKTHEMLHAADHKKGFHDVIVKWDKKLEKAKADSTTFNAASVSAAEAALYTAMGGTPDDIGKAQFNKWIALNNVTHTGTTTATGGPATPSNSAANPTCTTSSLDLT